MEQARNFKWESGTNKFSLYGIDFTMEEGSTEGYASLEDASEMIGVSLEEVKKILIEYEILDKNGNLQTEEAEETITLEDGNTHNMPKGCFAVLPCPVAKRDNLDKRYIYVNVDFLKQLVQRS